MKATAIVSGGMDSVTLVHFLHNKYTDLELHCLSFDYGQRHSRELMYARDCAFDFDDAWHLVDLYSLGSMLAESGSTLVDLSKDVPEGHYAEESMKATVVPNRNAIMLSIATGVAVAEGADFVATGVHAGDHFIYPDCRPQFISDMHNAMLSGNEGFCKPDFYIYAPFLHISKTVIARTGKSLGVDFTKTWSCYKGGDIHCGRCGTCTERKEALGEDDPTTYEV